MKRKTTANANKITLIPGSVDATKDDIKISVNKYRICPFCKSTRIADIKTAYNEYYIFCGRCGVSTGLRKTIKAAKNAWNKRIYDDVTIEGEIVTDILEC